jgi:epoxyqueuosine reductase
MLLGAIYTTADLPPLREAGTLGSCGSCTACITACPTGAIVAPYQVDARRCIAYLTVEYKGPVDEELRPKLGNHVFGCDDCLTACPWNKYASYPSDPTLLPRAELNAPQLRDFLELDDATFREVFSKSPIKRTGRNAFVRNCLYAAGNSGLKSFIPQVERLTRDPDAVVADAARWALRRLRPG